MKASDLHKLAACFGPEDIEWKPGAVTKDRRKGLAMAYVTNRAIQERLDDVCGPGDWRNTYQQGPEGGVLCGIAVRVEREDGTVDWVTKWDGAENTEVESVKGGLSGSMKRAAVQWGIGRYLYKLPAQWVPLNERGRFEREPAIPAAFLPAPAASGDGSAPSGPPAPAAPSAPRRRAEGGAPPERARRKAPARRGGEGGKPGAEDYFLPGDLPF